MNDRRPQAQENAVERPVQVGIGLVSRADSYLVRQRPLGGPMPGYWEFPGGKCELGEPPRDAALRECREELGLTVQILRLRRVVDYRYPHAWVEMSFFDCVLDDPAAEPAPATGFHWVPVRELSALRFPGANDAVLDELVRESQPAEAPQLGGSQ